jgi:hypothetical protein
MVNLIRPIVVRGTGFSNLKEIILVLINNDHVLIIQDSIMIIIILI